MSYNDTIKCPSCLKENDVEKLEQNTEYGCWSGEEVTVSCLNCEHYFDVQCEHQGYSARIDSFDMNEFLKAHKIIIPNNISRIFATHYFRDLVEDGSTRLVVSDNKDYLDQNPSWASAYEFATKEWDRIKKDLESE